MKATVWITLIAILTTGSCKPLLSSSGTEAGPIVPVDTTQTLSTIAFGSCNRTDLEQPLWDDILAQQPDLWIWLGDNVYADTRDMDVMQEKYQQQRQQPGYQQLLASVPMVGIWDDHDYGINDGGKHYAQKEESRDLLLDFLDVPKTNDVWDRDGAYQSYTFGPEGKRVKVILLDTRYFRDTLVHSEEEGRRYTENPEGDILGEAQWQWLTQELTQSDAQVNIIGSSIQVIAEDHGWEKWANFPEARQRLFNLIADASPGRCATQRRPPHRRNIALRCAQPTLFQGVVLLSGDRHIGEISRLDVLNLPYSLYDITSSGLTHSFEQANEENQHRVSPLITSLNFGLIKINWNKKPISLTYQIVGEEEKVFAEKQVRY